MSLQYVEIRFHNFVQKSLIKKKKSSEKYGWKERC